MTAARTSSPGDQDHHGDQTAGAAPQTAPAPPSKKIEEHLTLSGQQTGGKSGDMSKYLLQLDGAMRQNTKESLAFAWKLIHWMLGSTSSEQSEKKTDADANEKIDILEDKENVNPTTHPNGVAKKARTREMIPPALIVSLLLKKTCVINWVELLYDATTLLRNVYLPLNPPDLDEVVLNAILDGYSRLSQRGGHLYMKTKAALSHMETLFQDMKASKFGPRAAAGVVSYGIMIKALGDVPEQLPRVLSLWDELLDKAEMAEAYGDCERMGKYQPTVITYGCVLDALGKARQQAAMETAVVIWEKMGTAATAGHQAMKKNCVLYSTVIKGFARIGDLAMCDKFYREMVEEGVLPNVICMNALLGIAVVKKNLPLAEQYFGAMRGFGFYPDTTSYLLLIRGYLSLAHFPTEKEAVRAFELFRDGTSFANVKLDAPQILVLLKGLLEKKKAEHMIETFRIAASKTAISIPTRHCRLGESATPTTGNKMTCVIPQSAAKLVFTQTLACFSPSIVRNLRSVLKSLEILTEHELARIERSNYRMPEEREWAALFAEMGVINTEAESPAFSCSSPQFGRENSLRTASFATSVSSLPTPASATTSRSRGKPVSFASSNVDATSATSTGVGAAASAGGLFGAGGASRSCSGKSTPLQQSNSSTTTRGAGGGAQHQELVVPHDDYSSPSFSRQHPAGGNISKGGAALSRYGPFFNASSSAQNKGKGATFAGKEPSLHRGKDKHGPFFQSKQNDMRFGSAIGDKPGALPPTFFSSSKGLSAPPYITKRGTRYRGRHNSWLPILGKEEAVKLMTVYPGIRPEEGSAPPNPTTHDEDEEHAHETELESYYDCMTTSVEFEMSAVEQEAGKTPNTAGVVLDGKQQLFMGEHGLAAAENEEEARSGPGGATAGFLNPVDRLIQMSLGLTGSSCTPKSEDQLFTSSCASARSEGPAPAVDPLLRHPAPGLDFAALAMEEVYSPTEAGEQNQNQNAGQQLRNSKLACFAELGSGAQKKTTSRADTFGLLPRTGGETTDDAWAVGGLPCPVEDLGDEGGSTFFKRKGRPTPLQLDFSPAEKTPNPSRVLAKRVSIGSISRDGSDTETPEKYWQRVQEKMNGMTADPFSTPGCAPDHAAPGTSTDTCDVDHGVLERTESEGAGNVNQKSAHHPLPPAAPFERRSKSKDTTPPPPPPPPMLIYQSNGRVLPQPPAPPRASPERPPVGAVAAAMAAAKGLPVPPPPPACFPHQNQRFIPVQLLRGIVHDGGHQLSSLSPPLAPSQQFVSGAHPLQTLAPAALNMNPHLLLSPGGAIVQASSSTHQPGLLMQQHATTSAADHGPLLAVVPPPPPMVQQHVLHAAPLGGPPRVMPTPTSGREVVFDGRVTPSMFRQTHDLEKFLAEYEKNEGSGSEMEMVPPPPPESESSRTRRGTHEMIIALQAPEGVRADCPLPPREQDEAHYFLGQASRPGSAESSQPPLQWDCDASFQKDGADFFQTSAEAAQRSPQATHRSTSRGAEDAHAEERAPAVHLPSYYGPLPGEQGDSGTAPVFPYHHEFLVHTSENKSGTGTIDEEQVQNEHSLAAKMLRTWQDRNKPFLQRDDVRDDARFRDLTVNLLGPNAVEASNLEMKNGRDENHFCSPIPTPHSRGTAAAPAAAKNQGSLLVQSNLHDLLLAATSEEEEEEESGKSEQELLVELAEQRRLEEEEEREKIAKLPAATRERLAFYEAIENGTFWQEHNCAAWTPSFRKRQEERNAFFEENEGWVPENIHDTKKPSWASVLARAKTVSTSCSVVPVLVPSPSRKRRSGAAGPRQ